MTSEKSLLHREKLKGTSHTSLAVFIFIHMNIEFFFIASFHHVTQTYTYTNQCSIVQFEQEMSLIQRQFLLFSTYVNSHLRVILFKQLPYRLLSLFVYVLFVFFPSLLIMVILFLTSFVCYVTYLYMSSVKPYQKYLFCLHIFSR